MIASRLGIHWVTILSILLVAGGFIGQNVRCKRGEDIIIVLNGILDIRSSCVYGWPFTALRRLVPWDYDIQAANTLAWPDAARNYLLDWRAVAANALLALIAVKCTFIVMQLITRFCRLRNQFGIRIMLALNALTAEICAMTYYHIIGVDDVSEVMSFFGLLCMCIVFAILCAKCMGRARAACLGLNQARRSIISREDNGDMLL